MEQVTHSEFIAKIATDFGINIEKEFILKLPADKKTMKDFTQSIAKKVRIFDGQNEYPFMLSGKRNEDALMIGVELRYKGEKDTAEIIKESGVKLEYKNCKISEGGGWYSSGTRYIYKDIYCEI